MKTPISMIVIHPDPRDEKGYMAQTSFWLNRTEMKFNCSKEAVEKMIEIANQEVVKEIEKLKSDLQ